MDGCAAALLNGMALEISGLIWINAFGAATVCLIGGGLTAAVAALGLAHPAIRAVD